MGQTFWPLQETQSIVYLQSHRSRLETLKMHSDWGSTHSSLHASQSHLRLLIGRQLLAFCILFCCPFSCQLIKSVSRNWVNYFIKKASVLFLHFKHTHVFQPFLLCRLLLVLSAKITAITTKSAVLSSFAKLGIENWCFCYSSCNQLIKNNGISRRNQEFSKHRIYHCTTFCR